VADMYQADVRCLDDVNISEGKVEAWNCCFLCVTLFELIVSV